MTAGEEAKGGEKKTTWTTWEELLLACAVKRHGLKDWDSVTMEIQTRTSSSNLFTPQICRNKYHELRRRFRDHHDEPPAADNCDDEDSIPWIEELRKLRVAELTQEVQRYDLSIQSLQLKVKRLEGEREHSLKDNEEKDDEKPDLEMDSKTNRSENNKIDADGEPATVSPANTAGKEDSGEHSNRSFNESNSSENREKTGGGRVSESEPVQTGCDVKPDPGSKTVREDSCNDSSDTVAKNLATKASHKEKKDSDEVGDSEATESKDGTKDSSDVQSSASLTKKKRRKPGEVSRGGGSGGGGGSGKEEPVVLSPATTTATTIKREVVVKSEPLVAVMDIIRSHKHGSLFERRLESQKTEKYNKIVRQHVDLRIVQTRIDDGSYSSCINKFYLDLLLIFNNAIVYFPKSSAESMAAHELRILVLKEMRKKPIDRKKSDSSLKSEPAPLCPKPELERSDSLLAKQKSAAPIVVCRKRSSISSGKPSSSSKAGEKEALAKPLVIPKPPVKTSSNEEEGSMKIKMKEKPVTGVRSMRRSGNISRSNSTTNVGPSKNQMTSSSSNLGNSTSKGSDGHGHGHGHAAPAKVEKRKAEVTPVVKKRGAADFLKRIKKNSPGKGTVAETLKNAGSAEDGGSGGGSRKDQVKKKVEERKDGMTARQKSGSSGGGGKQVKEDISPSKRGVGRPPKKGKEVVPGKRGRETVEPEAASKRPTKRSRR